jgi:hypothetical protein
MKTYLCIQESDASDQKNGEGVDPLFLESGQYQAFLPQIGDLITVNTAPRKVKGDINRCNWTTKGVYKVIARNYLVYSQEGSDDEMTCELSVEKFA